MILFHNYSFYNIIFYTIYENYTNNILLKMIYIILVIYIYYIFINVNMSLIKKMNNTTSDINNLIQNSIWNSFSYMDFGNRFNFAITCRKILKYFNTYKHTEYVFLIDINRLESTLLFPTIQYSCDITRNNISDANLLSNLHRLTLKRCHNIVNIEPLKNIEHLCFKYCKNISNFDCLTNVKYLELYGYDIINITKMYNLEFLKINDSKIEDLKFVSKLPKLKSIVLNNCSHIKSINDLKNIHKIYLIQCQCMQIININYYIQELYIYNCNWVRKINVNVPIKFLSYKSLYNNYHVEYNNFKNIEKYSINGYLHRFD